MGRGHFSRSTCLNVITFGMCRGESRGAQHGTAAREPPKNKAKSESCICQMHTSVFSKI